jgi:hypothetical protein
MALVNKYLVKYKKEDNKRAVKVDILTGWQLDNLLLSKKIRDSIKEIVHIDSQAFTPEEMMLARKFF